MQALTARFTKKRPSGLRPEGRISAVPPSFTSEHIYTYNLECLMSCNEDESEELMSNLVIYRFNFLGSSAQKLPSMISVLSTFQPTQNVSPSYGPDALSESFRHVLLFLMPLNILPVSFYNIKVHWVICQYDFCTTFFVATISTPVAATSLSSTSPI